MSDTVRRQGQTVAVVCQSLHSSSSQPRARQGEERSESKNRDQRERGPAVARQVERQARKRRPDEHGGDRAGVDERDSGTGRVRPEPLRRLEQRRERKTRRKAEAQRAEPREPRGPTRREEQGADGDGDQRPGEQAPTLGGPAQREAAATPATAR